MKKFLIGLICLMTVFTLTGCGKDTKKEETTTNDNTTTEETQNPSVALEDQEINGLTFENFGITKDSDDISIVYFEVSNYTEEPKTVNKITFTLYTQGVEIVTLSEDINGEIDTYETKIFTENFDADLSKVDEVKYTVE